MFNFYYSFYYGNIYLKVVAAYRKKYSDDVPDSFKAGLKLFLEVALGTPLFYLPNRWAVIAVYVKGE